METFYGDVLAVWRPWAENLSGHHLPSGHHMAGDAGNEIAVTEWDHDAPVSSRAPLFGLLGSNLVSELGNNFSVLAIPWFVLATGGNAGQIGRVVAAGTVPNTVSGMFGGALVDRVGPKRMSIVAHVVGSLTVAAIPLLHVTIGIAFWQLITLVALGAVLDGGAATSLLQDLGMHSPCASSNVVVKNAVSTS